MSFIVTVDDRCTACGACLATCPERALVAAPKRPRSVDARCTGCLACVEICPRDALSVVGAPPELVRFSPALTRLNPTRTREGL